ncbi:MAG: CRISPR-associated protein Cas5 [Cephaloticoccus sp.]|nr:CRISPR-associated protein Cas5 [Cephaloticoccus sp.]MCF7761513.1 CRISPR-associated protein Cas5 [Cephaloticoccus sp.]
MCPESDWSDRTASRIGPKRTRLPWDPWRSPACRGKAFRTHPSKSTPARGRSAPLAHWKRPSKYRKSRPGFPVPPPCAICQCRPPTIGWRSGLWCWRPGRLAANPPPPNSPQSAPPSSCRSPSRPWL